MTLFFDGLNSRILPALFKEVGFLNQGLKPLPQTPVGLLWSHRKIPVETKEALVLARNLKASSKRLLEKRPQTIYISQDPQSEKHDLLRALKEPLQPKKPLKAAERWELRGLLRHLQHPMHKPGDRGGDRPSPGRDQSRRGCWAERGETKRGGGRGLGGLAVIGVWGLWG